MQQDRVIRKRECAQVECLTSGVRWAFPQTPQLWGSLLAVRFAWEQFCNPPVPLSDLSFCPPHGLSFPSVRATSLELPANLLVLGVEGIKFQWEFAPAMSL